MKVPKAIRGATLALFAIVAVSFTPMSSSAAAVPAVIERSFSAGVSSTCALRGANAIYCVGDNSFKQLGAGHSVDSSEPLPVALIDAALSVTVGKSFACAIGLNQLGYCWGTNSTGQLAKGPLGLFQGGPYASQISSDKKLIDIQAGDDFGCALTQESRVLCWGAVAELTGLSQAESYPTDMNLSAVTAIGVGPGSLCYIKTSVYCVGAAPFPSTASLIPGTVGATEVSVGKDFACAVISSTVKCWGSNTKGELGQGNTNVIAEPVTVVGLNDIRSITAGNYFACALALSGSSFCWGDNASNQVSSGSAVQSLRVPTAITKAVSLDAGSNYLCAMLSDGAIKCVGDNSEGQSGKLTSSTTPIGPVYEGHFMQVSTGSNTTCAINKSGFSQELFAGNLFCWGDLVPSGISSTLFTDVAVGSVSACAITVSGSVRCWGSNGSGQLGDGSNRTATVPTVVSGLGSYKAQHIAAGSRHFCVNTADGLVFCWGDDSRQQLGYVPDSQTGNSKVAIAVAGIGNAVNISAGLYHSCALISGGSVSCWGDNSKKQIVNNLVTRVGVTAVSQSTTVVKVASGGYENCYLLADAKVNCVGDNTEYQSPGLLTGTYTDVAVGLNSVCLTKSQSNQVSCFGSNTNNKLGRTGLKSATPSDVGSLTAATISAGFRVVAVGDEHACAIRDNFFLYCWGLNTSGQLASSFGFPSAFAKVTVTVTGKANVGEKLSSSISLEESFSKATYSWFKASDGISAGLAVKGASSPSYVTAVTDLNKYLSAGVTLSKWGVTSEIYRSSNAGPIAKASRILVAPVPVISGDTKSGRLLLARTGAWETGTKLSYQWYRGTSKIAGAITATYKLSSSDVGKQISVWVTGSKTGLPKVVRKSAKTSKVSG